MSDKTMLVTLLKTSNEKAVHLICKRIIRNTYKIN